MMLCLSTLAVGIAEMRHAGTGEQSEMLLELIDQKPVPKKAFCSVALVCKGLKPPPARVKLYCKLKEVVPILAVSIKHKKKSLRQVKDLREMH